MKVSYKELLDPNTITLNINLNKTTVVALHELAIITMRQRVDEESKRKPTKVQYNKKLDKITPTWPLSLKNFSIVQFSFKKENQKKPVIVKSNAFASNPKPEDKTQDPKDHSERYALGDAINKAIRAGWLAKYKEEILTGFKTLPPSEKELKKYTNALKNVSIILFSEREPCNDKITNPSKTGAKTCGELFDAVLTGKDHNIYYSVDWQEGQRVEFDTVVGEARKQHYKNDDYFLQNKYIEENKNSSDHEKLQKALKLQSQERQEEQEESNMELRLEQKKRKLTDEFLFSKEDKQRSKHKKQDKKKDNHAPYKKKEKLKNFDALIKDVEFNYHESKSMQKNILPPKNKLHKLSGCEKKLKDVSTIKTSEDKYKQRSEKKDKFEKGPPFDRPFGKKKF